MTEKVKLPKAVCDALDWTKHINYTNAEICYNIKRKSFKQPVEILNEQDADLIMRALVLGYEPELSAEEQIKDLYYCPPEYRESSYRQGIRDALRIHGIHYDWLTDQND